MFFERIRMGFLSLAAAALAAGCNSGQILDLPQINPPTTQLAGPKFLKPGTWAGRGMTLVVDKTGAAKFELDCGSGESTEPIMLDEQGTFLAHARYTPGPGISSNDPSLCGSVPGPNPALLKGQVVNEHLSLTLSVRGIFSHDFRLKYGAPEDLIKCDMPAPTALCYPLQEGVWGGVGGELKVEKTARGSTATFSGTCSSYGKIDGPIWVKRVDAYSGTFTNSGSYLPPQDPNVQTFAEPQPHKAVYTGVITSEGNGFAADSLELIISDQETGERVKFFLRYGQPGTIPKCIPDPEPSALPAGLWGGLDIDMQVLSDNRTIGATVRFSCATGTILSRGPIYLDANGAFTYPGTIVPELIDPTAKIAFHAATYRGQLSRDGRGLKLQVDDELEKTTKNYVLYFGVPGNFSEFCKTLESGVWGGKRAELKVSEGAKEAHFSGVCGSEGKIYGPIGLRPVVPGVWAFTERGTYVPPQDPRLDIPTVIHKVVYAGLVTTSLLPTFAPVPDTLDLTIIDQDIGQKSQFHLTYGVPGTIPACVPSTNFDGDPWTDPPGFLWSGADPGSLWPD